MPETLYGDRIHDDAPALSAIGRGEDFVIPENPPYKVRRDGAKPTIVGGEFRISSIPVKFAAEPSAWLEYAHYYCDPGVEPPGIKHG